MSDKKGLSLVLVAAALVAVIVVVWLYFKNKAVVPPEYIPPEELPPEDEDDSGDTGDVPPGDPGTYPVESTTPAGWGWVLLAIKNASGQAVPGAVGMVEGDGKHYEAAAGLDGSNRAFVLVPYGTYSYGAKAPAYNTYWNVAIKITVDSWQMSPGPITLVTPGAGWLDRFRCTAGKVEQAKEEGGGVINWYVRSDLGPCGTTSQQFCKGGDLYAVAYDVNPTTGQTTPREVLVKANSPTCAGKISVRVADAQGRALFNALVKCQSKSTYTDSKGMATLTGLMEAHPGVVTASKVRYSSTSKEIEITPGTTSSATIYLGLLGGPKPT